MVDKKVDEFGQGNRLMYDEYWMIIPTSYVYVVCSKPYDANTDSYLDEFYECVDSINKRKVL